MGGHRAKNQRGTTGIPVNRKKSTKGRNNEQNSPTSTTVALETTPTCTGTPATAGLGNHQHRRRFSGKPFGLTSPQLNSVVFFFVAIRELYALRQAVHFSDDGASSDVWKRGSADSVSPPGLLPCTTYYHLSPTDNNGDAAGSCTADDSATLLLRYHSSSRFVALSLIIALVCWLNPSKLQAFLRTLAAFPLMAVVVGWRSADWIVRQRMRVEHALDPGAMGTEGGGLAAELASASSAFDLLSVNDSQRIITTTFGLLFLTYMGRGVPPVKRRRLPLRCRDCRLNDGIMLLFLGYLLFGVWDFVTGVSVPDGSRIVLHWVVADELAVVAGLVFGLICCSHNENRCILFFYGAINLFHAMYQLPRQEELFFAWGSSIMGTNLPPDGSTTLDNAGLYGRAAFGFLVAIAPRMGSVVPLSKAKSE